MTMSTFGPDDMQPRESFEVPLPPYVLTDMRADYGKESSGYDWRVLAAVDELERLRLHAEATRLQPGDLGWWP